MRIFLIISLLLINLLNAKDRDFYYSFIDSNGKQISSKTKEAILKTVDEIELIRTIMHDGKLNEALKKLTELKDSNKISLLNSDILILYVELILKKQSKKLLLDSSNELEKAINSSQISQEDLLNAYLLLIELKIGVNRIEDARYYAQTVIDIFDDEEAKARGKITLAKIFKYQKDYKKASKTLFEVLNSTKDRNVASLVGNELFDIYLLEDKKDEAKDLMKQILSSNPSFYTKDFTQAIQRSELLLKIGMEDFSILILEDLIKNSKKDEVIDQTKFKLANIYMKLNDKTNGYLLKAKPLYKSIIEDYPTSENFSDAQMSFDEIKMRQRLLTPSAIADKYPQDEDIQRKALLQELVNNNLDKNFDKAVKMEKAYLEIPKKILKRFGYEDVHELLDISYKELIKEYISKNECELLSGVLKDVKYEIFKEILETKELKEGLLACIGEIPSVENYTQLKNILNNAKDEDVYLMLETMAFAVDMIDDALYFSSKLEGSKDKEVLKEEFFIKYQVLKIKNDSVKMDKFFKYSLENRYLIDENISNPMIIDFYYDFYLYLQKEQNKDEAIKFLNSLHDKQNDIKVFVYSPFVESELSKIAKEEGNLQLAVDYLVETLSNSRRLKVEDEIKLYYDIATLYDSLKEIEKKDEYLQKCKDVKIEDSLYKKMCETLKP